MIVIYRLTSPAVVHAYHTNGQALTVAEAYDPDEFGAVRIPTTEIEVGGPFNAEGGVDVPLGTEGV